MSGPGKPVAALLLKYVDESFAAADIQPLTRRVIEEIVGIAHDVERLDFFSCGRVDRLIAPAISPAPSKAAASTATFFTVLPTSPVKLGISTPCSVALKFGLLLAFAGGQGNFLPGHILAVVFQD